MSDAPQGPGWWQASDDKWYPPPRPQLPGDPAPQITIGPPASPPHQQAPSPQATQPQSPPGPPHPSPPSPPSPDLQSPPGLTPSVGGPPSPFDMPPVSPSRPSSDKPVLLYAVLAVLVLGVLVSLFVLLSDDDGGGPTAGTTTSSPSSTEGSSTSGPDTTSGTTRDTSGQTDGEGDIVTVDKGLSTFTDVLSEDETFSWGAIVENQGELVAYGVDITVDFRNAEGQNVDTEFVTINVLLPGEQFGFGGNPIEGRADVVDIEVNADPPREWRQPEGYEPIPVEDVQVTYGNYDIPAVSYDAQNPYDERIDQVYVYAIFRNAAGDIIGGARESGAPALPPNEGISSQVEAYVSIPEIDEAKTEIYVDPASLT